MDNNTSVSVPIGPSEIAGFVVAVSGLLTTYFGKDWHLAANAQKLGIVVAGLVTIGVALARAIKHHSLNMAAATVQAAIIAADTRRAEVGLPAVGADNSAAPAVLVPPAPMPDLATDPVVDAAPATP